MTESGQLRPLWGAALHEALDDEKEETVVQGILGKAVSGVKYWQENEVGMF